MSSLIEQGTARTTTLEVQRRAGVSRGALLHHFPTVAQLLSATVGELVRRNEALDYGVIDTVISSRDAIDRTAAIR